MAVDNEEVYADVLNVFDRAGQGEPLTTSEVAEALGCSRPTARERLDLLADGGDLETKTVGAQGRVWWRPETDEAESDTRARHEQDHDGDPHGDGATGTEPGPDGPPVSPADVLARTSDAVLVLDGNGRVTYCNDRAVDLLDRGAAELRGEHVRETIPDVGDGTVGTGYERAVAAGEATSFVEYCPPLSKWLEVRAYPSGSGASVYVRDVTDREERERELEEYETIVETIQDGVYVLDEEFRFAKVNDAYCEMTGYDREELLGAHCSLVVDDDVVEESAELVRSISDGSEESATLEADILRRDGSRLRAESNFTSLPEDDPDAPRKLGVVRDVSERVERERELAALARQQGVVVDLGRRALVEHDLEGFMDAVVEAVAETLDADYATVLERRPDVGELLVRAGVGWRDGLVGEGTVDPGERSQAGYTLRSEEPVVVEDLDAEERFEGPDLLVDHDVTSGVSVVVGSCDDPWGILGVHDRDHGTFDDHDVNFVRSVANVLAAAIERADRETELERQRERLAAVNNLHLVVREIIEAVIEQSTREDVETVVCDRLAESDSYLFAWFGAVDSRTETVESRAEAGVEGYLEDETIPIDPGAPRAEAPTGRAIRTREVQVVRDVEAPDGNRLGDRAREYGVRSAAAIPVVHEGGTYGVLNVYADRRNAFGGEEREVLVQVGEVVGQAIAALDRKRALMGDEVIELGFRVRDVFESVDLPASTDGTITFEETVPLGEGNYLGYGTAPADAVEVLEALAERIDHWEEIRTLTEDSGTVRFEAKLAEPPVVSAVASRGGYIRDSRIEDGDFLLTTYLPPSRDVREVIDAVLDAYPTADLTTRRQRSRASATETDAVRPATETDAVRPATEDLTERQRATLLAAYHAGFFEWPRASSGEEVADSLGISPPTFHQHIRKAENKLLEALYADPVGGRE